MKNPFRRKPPMPSNRYVLGEEVIHPGKYVSIPRSAHLAILGESNSGKGSVIANIIKQEVIMGGEIWFIDLKAGMEAANYESVLDRKAYTLDEPRNCSVRSMPTWTLLQRNGAARLAI